ncbi:hypothetical protein ACIBO2_37665 [Nonomuraea sp. NPDC050022]|uniref:hypothetical protein n=1 Tax=Nonomuraea sp. NPDC050022 TaxID=3364358 RepID=UPI003799A976
MSLVKRSIGVGFVTHQREAVRGLCGCDRTEPGFRTSLSRCGLSAVNRGAPVAHVAGQLALLGQDERGQVGDTCCVRPLQRSVRPELGRTEVASVLVQPTAQFSELSLDVEELCCVDTLVDLAQLPDGIDLAFYCGDNS